MSSPSMDDRARSDISVHMWSWAEELGLPTNDKREDPRGVLGYLFESDGESEEIPSEDTHTRTRRKADERRERRARKADEDRIEFQKARDRLAPAETLRQEGKSVESILFCGVILREEMEKCFLRKREKTMLLRYCIMQLLLIFCQRHPDILRDWSHSTLRHHEYLDEVVRKIKSTDDVKLLKVIRELAGYTISFSSFDFPGPWVSAQVYDVMLSSYGAEDQETLLALKYLAESCVYDSCGSRFREVYPWQQREEWIYQHAIQIRKNLGADRPHALKYQYAMARTILAEGSVSKAKDNLREAFDGRVLAFQEAHTECDTFIDGLLEAYCDEYVGTALTRADYYDFRVEYTYLDELVQFCLSREAYEEIDTLVQECTFPQKATNARRGIEPSPAGLSSSSTGDARFNLD